jgi:hypothetical protein
MKCISRHKKGRKKPQGITVPATHLPTPPENTPNPIPCDEKKKTKKSQP